MGGGWGDILFISLLPPSLSPSLPPSSPFLPPSLTSVVSVQPCLAVRECLHYPLPQGPVAKTRTANPSMTWNGDEQVQLVDTRGKVWR